MFRKLKLIGMVMEVLKITLYNFFPELIMKIEKVRFVNICQLHGEKFTETG